MQTAKSLQSGFTRARREPPILEGNIYHYHNFEITIQEPRPGPNARFPRHNVRIRHLPCNHIEWRTLFTPTLTTLIRELTPLIEEWHPCRGGNAPAPPTRTSHRTPTPQH